MIWPLLAGGALFAGGLALVWAASRRRTVRVAVQELPARGGKAAVRVRVRYELPEGRPLGDPRDILGRLAHAAGRERSQELAALVHEAREDWGIAVLGFEIEKA